MAAVGAFAVESANVVGYAAAPDSVEQCNFLSIGFNSIGYNTCDIQQIKISDGGAGSIGWGTETFALWAGAPDVVAGSGAVYYDPSMDPNGKETDYYWADGEGNRVAFSILPAQGVVIDMPEGLSVQMAGQVSDADAEMMAVRAALAGARRRLLFGRGRRMLSLVLVQFTMIPAWIRTGWKPTTIGLMERAIS